MFELVFCWVLSLLLCMIDCYKQSICISASDKVHGSLIAPFVGLQDACVLILLSISSLIYMTGICWTC